MTTATPKPALPALPPCPRCGAALFDNRVDRAGPRSPLARCSNTLCVDALGRRSGFWEKDLAPKTAPAAPDPARPANGAGPAGAEFDRATAERHYRCLLHVVRNELPLIAALGGDTVGAVAAMTATLFIEHSRRTGGRHT